MKVSIEKLYILGNKSICLLSEEIFQALNLKGDSLYELHLGRSSEIVTVLPTVEKPSSIYVNEFVYENLIPFDNLNLNLWVDNKDIYLGPVVGIFETPMVISELINGEYSFYETQNILAALYEGCLCYYFSNEGIDWDKEKVQGTTFFPEKSKWSSFLFPMPDILYDVGIFLSDKLRPLAKETRSRLRSYPEIKLINSRNSIGKWELYEKLSKYASLKPCLPETIVYTNMGEIKRMLDKYKFIFLKSLNGSKGREVISIEDTEGIIKVNYYDCIEKKHRNLNFNFDDNLKTFILNFFGDRSFVIQQGIHLLKLQNRVFDLRILLNKNGKGLWNYEFIICRLAKKGSNITNTSTGGEILFYDKVYSMLKDDKPSFQIPSSNEILELAIKISDYIQLEFGLFGEIGMDLAIDDHGKLWLIEANAKPQKDLQEDLVDLYGNKFVDSVIESHRKHDKSFEIPYYKSQLVYPQALSTFKYAKFLTGCR